MRYIDCKIKTLKKGCLYKVKENPRWDDAYTIFCPKLTKNVVAEDYYRSIQFLFAIYGNGKAATICIQEKGIRAVRVIHGSYVKKLTTRDYIKVSRLLKKKGYVFDKKTKKLINLNP